MVKIYKSLVVPQLEYAAPVWQLADCSALDKIQRRGLASCLGVPASAGLNAVEAEANVLPLDLRREELSIREMARLLARNDTEPIKVTINSWIDTFSTVCERFMSPFGKMWMQINDMKSNTETCFHNLEPQFTYLEYLAPSRRRPEYWNTLGSSKNRSTAQENEAKKIIGDKMADSTTSTIIAFTDGSCKGNPGPCGAGACIFLPLQDSYIELKKAVSKQASILLGEIVAIKMTIQYCKDLQTQRSFSGVKIFSDSQSAVGTLQLDWNTQNYKSTIRETKKLISELQDKGITVELIWTPGHANIQGNAIADSLAKEAATEAEKMEENVSVTTQADIKTAAKKSTIMKWQSRWEVSTSGRHLYQFTPDVGRKKAPTYTETERFIHQLRTGYCSLNSYRHSIGLTESGQCQCGSIETVQHYIEDCPIYEEQREKLRLEMYQSIGLYGFNCHTLHDRTKEDQHRELRNNLHQTLHAFIVASGRFDVSRPTTR